MKKEKSPKIAALPLDDRPITYDLVKMLAEYTDYKVELPGKALLGKFLKPGKPQQLESWLRRYAKKSDAVLICVDSLLFGNLIASRLSDKNYTKMLKKLSFIKKLAKQKKCEDVYVFNVLMRLLPPTKNKKDALFIEKLEKFLSISYNKIKFKKVAFKENWWDVYKLEDEAKKLGLPWGKVKEYLRARLRGHKINLLMLDWAKEGLFEYLIICLDDTKNVSINYVEKDVLRKKLKALNLKDKVSIYPGTDEAIQLLLARYLIKAKDTKPRIYIDFLPSYGSRVIPLYEDTPIKEIISEQICAVGALQVAIAEQADLVLMVNAPINEQYEAASQEGKILQKNRLFIYKEFLHKLNKYLQADKLVAVADVAFANGADIGLAEVLRRNIDMTKLAAYSAWNTASNALGTAITQAVLYTLYPEARKSKAHYRLMINRLLDDWLYQSVVRPFVKGKINTKKVDVHNLGGQTSKVQQLVAKSMRKVSQRLFNETFKNHPEIAKIKLKKVRLPWPRLFEVDLDVEVKLKK